MAEEMTMADYEAKRKELDAIAAALKAQGKEIVDADGKPLYKSKLFWANMIAIGSLVVNQLWGVAISEEELAIFLGAIIPMVNIFLRYRAKDITGVV